MFGEGGNFPSEVKWEETLHLQLLSVDFSLPSLVTEFVLF